MQKSRRLIEAQSGPQSGYVGGTTPAGALIMRLVPDVLDTEHAELGVRRNRFRWARGAPDTVLWSGAPEDDVEQTVADALERKTGRSIARNRYYPEGYDTWVARVTGRDQSWMRPSAPWSGVSSGRGGSTAVIEATINAGKLSVEERDLPDDMRQLLIDYFGAVKKPVPSRLPTRWVPVIAFPSVEFPDDESDDRGGVGHANKMVKADKLPPVIVADGKLLDGRHRVWAARRRGDKQILAVDLTGMGVSEKQWEIGKLNETGCARRAIEDRCPRASQMSAPRGANQRNYRVTVITDPSLRAQSEVVTARSFRQAFEKATERQASEFKVTYSEGNAIPTRSLARAKSARFSSPYLWARVEIVESRQSAAVGAAIERARRIVEAAVHGHPSEIYRVPKNASREYVVAAALYFFAESESGLGDGNREAVLHRPPEGFE